MSEPDTNRASDLVTMEALFLFFRYEFNDIVGCASDDVTQFLQRKHIDVLIVSEIVQYSVADSFL